MYVVACLYSDGDNAAYQFEELSEAWEFARKNAQIMKSIYGDIAYISQKENEMITMTIFLEDKTLHYHWGICRLYD